MKKIIFIIIFFTCSNLSAAEKCNSSTNTTYTIENYNNGLIKNYTLIVKNKVAGYFGTGLDDNNNIIIWSVNILDDLAKSYSIMLKNNNFSTMNICKK